MQQPGEENIEAYKVGELVRDSLRFFVAHVDLILAVLALMAGGLLLALLLLLMTPVWLGVVLTLIGFFLVSSWTTASLYWICLNADRRPICIADALRATWGRPSLRWGWTGVVATLGVALGLAFFLIPGIFFLFRYYMLWGVVVIAEGRFGIDAVRRSRQLSEGQRLVRICLAFVLLYFAIAVVEGLLSVSLALVSGTSVDRNAIVTFLTAGLGVIWPTLVYLRRTSWVGEGVPIPSVRRWPRAVFAGLSFVVCAALVGHRVVVEAFWIPSGAMIPTLEIGDHLFVNRLAYGLWLPLTNRPGPAMSPQRGDVAVYVSPSPEPVLLIKRIVALEGDLIELRDKQVIINGEPQDEPYAHFFDANRNDVPRRDNFGPETVPPGHFFVLGDNRDHSHDSRYYGTVPLENLRGRAMFIYWSRDKESITPRWDRIGMAIE